MVDLRPLLKILWLVFICMLAVLMGLMLIDTIMRVFG